MKSFDRLLITLCLLTALTACAVNPVTGEREFTMVSEAQEIQIGEENYGYMQQAGGGEYDVDPQLTEYVRGVGERLVAASRRLAVTERQLPYEFVVLNSSVPNAWALPGGKIAINRGLMTELGSEAELAAVIGHEIVHAAARHTAQRMERGTWLQIGVIGTAILTGNSGYSDLAVGGASVGAQLLSQSYGRGAELQSDEYGMRYMSDAGYDPQGAVTLQETFVRLSEGRESDWLSGLFASHPPSQERVEANKRTAASLPPGGELGVERYKAAMSKTLRVKPAYDAYDEGRKALREKNTKLAIEKAAAAIEMFPEEAHFYSLRGDARYTDEQYEQAIRNYDTAIRRRDDFFQYYLQRGLSNEKLGNDTTAVNDLEKSNELFPTAIAHYALGNIAARHGDKAKAIEHYTMVAGGNDETAAAARAALVRLDLEDNPGKYIQVRCFQDNNGNLGLTIGNPTPLDVTGIRYLVQYRDSFGNQSREQSLSGTLAAGSAANVSTGIGPYPAGSSCPVQITAARVAN
ncbi:MAG: M48 family metalloprotease [Woeseiaceae bacterium]|nr:M48 family metalloprotease [Woeseiaceae bacterium]